ncbi:MAG TPA: class I SAM-dependent methyltransferase [Myxococcales bacterium]|nr:class I SAM-dependent methyltransferase [Myxococcales bacterium]
MATTVEIRCPACLGRQADEAEATPRLRVRRCRACGHRVADFAGAAPSRDDDYLLQEGSGEPYTASLRQTRLRQARRILRAIQQEAGPVEGLLDYGCGRGWLLEVARSQGIAPLAGVDTSGTAMESLAELGVDAVRIEEPMHPARVVRRLRFRPRVVTLLDVVEHISPDRLDGWLAELLDALRPDLRFAVIKVPISGGVMYRMAAALARAGVAAPLEQLYKVGCSPPHLHYFSARSMEALLERLRLPVARVVRDPEFDAGGLKERATFLRRLPAPLATAAGGAAIGVARALRMEDTAAFLCRA